MRAFARASRLRSLTELSLLIRLRRLGMDLEYRPRVWRNHPDGRNCFWCVLACCSGREVDEELILLAFAVEINAEGTMKYLVSRLFPTSPQVANSS